LLRSFQVNRLCKELIVKCDYHIEKFTRKYVEDGKLPTGQYRLSTDPQDLVPFIPVKS